MWVKVTPHAAVKWAQMVLVQSRCGNTLSFVSLPGAPPLGQDHTGILHSVRRTNLDSTTENIFKSPSVVREEDSTHGGSVSNLLWRQNNPHSNPISVNYESMALSKLSDLFTP